jgi:hypothetical protein
VTAGARSVRQGGDQESTRMGRHVPPIRDQFD